MGRGKQKGLIDRSRDIHTRCTHHECTRGGQAKSAAKRDCITLGCKNRYRHVWPKIFQAVRYYRLKNFYPHTSRITARSAGAAVVGGQWVPGAASWRGATLHTATPPISPSRTKTNKKRTFPNKRPKMLVFVQKSENIPQNPIISLPSARPSPHRGPSPLPIETLGCGGQWSM